MKKMNLIQCGFYAFIALMASCTADEVVQEQAEAKDIVMIAHDFEGEDGSRTNISISPEGGRFTWAKGDVVGIFPNVGRQVDFPITNGAGSNQAKFDGGGWALKASSKYMAYYPLVRDFELRSTSIPVYYDGQVQKGNGSTAHLGKFDFMAAKATTPQSGNVNFDFVHLGALVEVNFTLQNKGDLRSVMLSSDVDFFTVNGTFNLTAAKPAISATKKRNRFQVNIENVVTAPNAAIKVYLMMAPTNLTGKKIKLSLYNGESYEGYAEGKNFEAGRAYSLNFDVKQISRFVDLGLPSGLRWAKYNLGASSPQEHGSYYAWGEIESKVNFNEKNSLTWKVPWSTSISGDPEYDAATANWGEPVRLPTNAEADELIKNTTPQWTTMNGVIGLKLTGKNGNSIFLPATGYKYGGAVSGKDLYGSYWTGTPDRDQFGGYILIKEKDFSRGINYRWFGLSIRPVRNAK